MTLPTPKFFVLDHEGNLHGYDREDILKCDLATPTINPSNSANQIFRLNESGLTISYSPITIAELGMSIDCRADDSKLTCHLRAAA